MIKQLLYELTRGIAYRRIRHDEMRLYTTILPLSLTAAIVVFYLALPIKPPLIGEGGIASKLTTLISTLPGFYFAGLAAVATFGNPSIDVEMPKPTPTVPMRINGRDVHVPLSRRLFLSYLFSYLVILSFSVATVLIGFDAISDTVALLKAGVIGFFGDEKVWYFMKAVVTLPITFMLSSMLVSTLHGVFFLTEKIHQP